PRPVLRGAAELHRLVQQRAALAAPAEPRLSHPARGHARLRATELHPHRRGDLGAHPRGHRAHRSDHRTHRRVHTSLRRYQRMTAAEFQNITKTFGDFTAVDAVSLEIPRGKLTTLLGPSGCGKTTSLRILAGYLAPDAGQILIHGTDATRTPPEKRNLGMV